MIPSLSASSFQPQARVEQSTIASARWRAPLTERTSFLGSLLRLFQRSYELLGHAKDRRLRVAETVSLGEKRFVAILTVDGVEYLVGGGASAVSLLTTLPKPSAPENAPFSEAVEHAWQGQERA